MQDHPTTAHRCSEGEQMRAVQVSAPGGPEALELVERPDPEARPGHVVVDITAAGVNFIDTYQRSGIYPVPYPLVLGGEGAGRVTAVGPGVGDIEGGDRGAWQGSPGAYAEQAAVPAQRCVPVPDGVSDETAAALL